MYKKIFLIGFMGCGKSFTANYISHELNLKNFDLDAIIEEKEKMSVTQVFELKGEAYFRALERDCLVELVNLSCDFVLACGGGTPCFYNNMNLMNKIGLTIWLNEDEGVIFDRLCKEKEKRPLIKNLNFDDLKTFISKKNLERKEFYEKARIITQKDMSLINKIMEYYGK